MSLDAGDCKHTVCFPASRFHVKKKNQNHISWQQLSLNMRNEVVKVLQNHSSKCWKRVPPPPGKEELWS